MERSASDGCMTGTLHWCYCLVRNLTKEKGMSTTTAHADHAPLITVFAVQPERARELADLLTAATEDVMQHIDGFISANIHLSTDGNRVVHYAQWRDRESGV